MVSINKMSTVNKASSNFPTLCTHFCTPFTVSIAVHVWNCLCKVHFQHIFPPSIPNSSSIRSVSGTLFLHIGIKGSERLINFFRITQLERDNIFIPELLFPSSLGKPCWSSACVTICKF